ncbi:hypothetical protein BDW66DRAFT_160973 [Aspergillus desertorum]
MAIHLCQPDVFLPLDPFVLTAQDILTVLLLLPLLPNTIFPLYPLSSRLDELYPTLRNLRDLCLQTILFLSQLFLLISCPLLSQPSGQSLHSVNGLGTDREDGVWFFINGIATGTHWHGSNLTLLASTFGREIIGIKNSIAHTRKAVLIAHSDEGIIAFAILNWLHAEVGDEQLRKLEVYTFSTLNGDGYVRERERALGSSSSRWNTNTNYIHNEHSHQVTPFNQFHGPFMNKLVDSSMNEGIVQRPLGDMSRLWNIVMATGIRMEWMLRAPRDEKAFRVLQ